MNAFINFYAAPAEITSHAATLMAIAPLIGACIAVLGLGPRLAGASVIGAASISFWMALCLSGEVARQGAVDENFGGLASPLRIVAHIDALGAFFALSLSGVGLAAAIFAGFNSEAAVAGERCRGSDATFLLCLSGIYGVTLTGDAVTAFVFLEAAAIAAYARIRNASKDGRRSTAALSYVVAAVVGSALFALGVGFLFGATGALNMADLAQRLATLGEERAVQAGFSLILVGLALKAGLFPLTGWLFEVDVEAKPANRLLLSSLMTTATLYLLLRFLMTVFGLLLGPVDRVLAWIVAPLSAFGALAAAFQALQSKDLGRFAASSSAAQISLATLCIAIGGRRGVAAGLVLLLAQMLSKAALTLALSLGAGGDRSLQRDEVAGEGRRTPGAMAMLAAAAFMLVGGPLTLGFWAKWRLVEAMLAIGRGWAVAVIALVSLILLVSLGRWLEIIFIARPGEPRPQENRIADRRRLSLWAPLGLLAALSLWFGFDASLPLSFADVAAQVARPAP